MTHTDFIDELSKLLKHMCDEPDADAAVALLLKLTNFGMEVLFVKRVESPADPWSGQMALPGGKREERDQHLKQTVIRETLEETSIDLLSQCRFLGALESLSSIRVPELRVLPFVVLLMHEPSIRLNTELETHIWVPIKELANCKGMREFSWGKSPAYIVGGHIIWGLTYRILERFLHTYMLASKPAGVPTSTENADLGRHP